MLHDQFRKINAFWNTIFPASKRLMTPDGQMHGDNTDVRAPTEAELWQGGSFSMNSGSGNEFLEPVKLTLDGVFFVDGGFAGPNRLGAWEQTVFAAEAHVACAALARESLDRSDFFTQVRELTGQIDETRLPIPPAPRSPESGPDPESIRRFERQLVGFAVLEMRKSLGPETAIARIAAWNQAPAPTLYKL
jgi:hypothetical protein